MVLVSWRCLCDVSILSVISGCCRGCPRWCPGGVPVVSLGGALVASRWCLGFRVLLLECCVYFGAGLVRAVCALWSWPLAVLVPLQAAAGCCFCRVLLSECCVRFGAGVLVLLQGAAVKAAVVGRARLLVLLQSASAGYCQRVVCILGLWVEIALCCNKKKASA